MDNLRSTLVKMLESIGTLESLLAEEMSQLGRPQINPVSLQIISDTKSRLLSTLGYYDEIRTKEERRLGLVAPYEGHAAFSRTWKSIIERVASSNALNEHIATLLNMHLKKNNDLKKMMNQVGGISATYGQDGTSRDAASGKIYNISI